MINYTIVNNEARKTLDLSIPEYCIADIIHNLATNPSNKENWCYAKKEDLADFIGISRATTFRAIKKLLDLGLLEKNPNINNLLRATPKWYDTVMIKRPSQNETPSLKMRPTPSQNETVGVSKRDSYYYKDNNKDINNDISNGQAVAVSEGRDINHLLNLFEPINPSYENLFANKTQRLALSRLLKRYGAVKLEDMLMRLPEILSKRFAPVITTPCQLENKMGELKLFVQKEKGGSNGQKRRISFINPS